MLKPDFVFFLSSSLRFFLFSYTHQIILYSIVFLSSSLTFYASIVSSKKGLLSLFFFFSTFITKMHKKKKATRKETKMHAVLILPACAEGINRQKNEREKKRMRRESKKWRTTPQKLGSMSMDAWRWRLMREILRNYFVVKEKSERKTDGYRFDNELRQKTSRPARISVFFSKQWESYTHTYMRGPVIPVEIDEEKKCHDEDAFTWM